MFFDRRQLNICPRKYPSVSYIRYREALRWPFKTLKKTKEIHYVRVVRIYEKPVIQLLLLWVCPVYPSPDLEDSAQCTPFSGSLGHSLVLG